MSVQYDPTLGDSQSYDDFPFAGKEAIVRFAGFRRSDDGRILVLERSTFDYDKDAVGQWLRKGKTAEEGPTPVSPEDVEYQDNIYWQFTIVSPVEFAGKTLPLRGALKGVVAKLEADGQWHFNLTRRAMGLDDPQYMTGLFVIAQKCGLDTAAMDEESQMYDPSYVSNSLEVLGAIVQSGMPLEVTDVLEHLVEAKLREAADGGLLLRVKTSDKSNWIQYASVTPLTPEQASRFHATAQAGQDQASALRDQVRAMIPAEGDEHQEFLKRVYAEAGTIHPGLPQSGMLADLNAAELQQLVDKLAPRTPEGGEEEMTL